MKHTIYYLFISLMLVGNCFAAFKLLTAKEAFLTQFPKLTENGLNWLRAIPLITIGVLIGMLFWQKWAGWAAIALSLVVIGMDIYFGMRYHLAVAIPSFLLLLFFVYIFYYK